MNERGPGYYGLKARADYKGHRIVVNHIGENLYHLFIDNEMAPEPISAKHYVEALNKGKEVVDAYLRSSMQRM